MEFLPRIKQQCDAVVNITTGGGHGMSLEERLAAPLTAKPEMCSLNMGSMNFGLFPMLDKMQGVPARLGAAAPRELSATSSSATPSRISSIS